MLTDQFGVATVLDVAHAPVLVQSVRAGCVSVSIKARLASRVVVVGLDPEGNRPSFLTVNSESCAANLSFHVM